MDNNQTLGIEPAVKAVLRRMPWLYNTLAGLRSRKQIFTNIYKTKSWDREAPSKSGYGSSLEQTKILREELPIFITEWKIKTMLDIPCGDFFWLKETELPVTDYIGADIVEALIRDNCAAYQTEHRHFMVLDIVDDKVPLVDLIFCRDLFVHFSDSLIKQAVRNIKKSNSKYLLTTTYTRHSENQDINTGGWRPLNLEISPFRFPPALHIINEGCTEWNGVYADKCLGLWKVENLPDF
jgi:hypothetical protein